MKQFFHGLAWYVKQLFPLTYRSHYGDHKGNRFFAVWKMWFGKVYKHDCYDITGKENLAWKGLAWKGKYGQ